MELRREARFHHFPTTIFLFAIVFGFIFRIGVLIRMSVRFFLLTKINAMRTLIRYSLPETITYNGKIYLRDDKEALKENEITRRQAIRIERYIKNE